VSFGLNKTPMAAGSCERPGAAGVFTDTSGTWQSAGLALPAAYRGDQAQVLGLAATSGGNVALLLAGDSLLAAWSNGTHWTVSAPVAGGAVRASGFGTGGSTWLLLSDGFRATAAEQQPRAPAGPEARRAETVSGTGGSWQALPAVPAGTATLAPGPGGSYDALAVAGTKLTVWRLTRGAWAQVQRINVPVEYGSSS
jgi:hypothetical protein